MVSRIDQLRRHHIDLGPEDLGGARDVPAVAFRTSVRRLREPGLDPIAGGAVLEVGVIADPDRLHVTAVIGLDTEPHGSPKHRLPDARAGQPGDLPKVAVASLGDPQREPLVESVRLDRTLAFSGLRTKLTVGLGIGAAVSRRTGSGRSKWGRGEERMMGLEPTTFCMASRRSSQLSYIRIGRRIIAPGFALLFAARQG